MVLSTALMCLALNVYYESRGEPTAGQYAVALVTMNRARGEHERVCKEVYKPYQFSWTHEGHGHPKNAKAWAKARKVAKETLLGKVVDFTGGATHFHTKRVNPKWRYKLEYVMTLGGHLFYRVT